MGSTSFTNPYASEVIRSRRGELVRGIAHTERLLELLISQGVLQEDSRGVMSGLSGAEERNAQLLSLLLARGERACRAFFYPCLKRAQPDLYCRVRSYVGGLKDARRQLIGYLLEKDRRGLREETRRGACPVRDAVCAGDLCVLQELTTGLDVNATPSPLLHLAARHGRESIVYFLLRKGAWPDRADHQGRTALHVAAQKGQTGVVRALVRAGADVHATDREGQTALQLAARHAHHETVSALREGRSLTPLSHQVGGVCEVKPELMECLNQSDTDVDGRTEPGQDTEISIADEARTLLDKGQDPASQGPEVVTPPHLAVTQGGFTALHQANTEGVAQLQERQGGAALHWASAGGHTRLVKLLLDTGADANAPDRERRTPLHLAAAHGHAHIITQLLAGGAKRGARDRHGSSPLHHAARNGHREAAEVLLASCGGASVDERNIWRRSALHLAAQHGRDTLVELLLENRAHINCLDGNRDTPLHCACRAGHLGAAQRLIGWCRGQRANLRATNAVKKSALQVAEGGDTPTHCSISTLLKKKMLLVK